MPKRQRTRRIPTPAWGERPKGRVRRELGGRLYLVAAFFGLVVVAGVVIVFAFVKDYLDERALPGSTAIAVDDRSYKLDYFAARLRLFNEQTGGGVQLATGIDVVAGQLVEEETVRRFADELDVSVTAEEVDAELASRLGVEADDPGFADAYQVELEVRGVSDEEYRQMVQGQLLANKVREKLGADIPAEAEQVLYSLIQVATDAEAQQVVARLQAGEDFAALAKEISTDVQSKDQGGDRGWLAKGAADPPLEDTIFSLEPGAFSDPYPIGTDLFIFQAREKAVRPLDDNQRQQLEAQTYQRWLDEKQQSLEINNYVAVDSLQVDEDKLRWVVEHV